MRRTYERTSDGPLSFLERLQSGNKVESGISTVVSSSMQLLLSFVAFIYSFQPPASLDGVEQINAREETVCSSNTRFCAIVVLRRAGLRSHFSERVVRQGSCLPDNALAQRVTDGTRSTCLSPHPPPPPKKKIVAPSYIEIAANCNIAQARILKKSRQLFMVL